MEKFRSIKKEIRILAFDDGPFEFKSKGKDILVGTIFRGGEFMDGLLKTEIEIDGTDATKKIIDVANKSKHKDIRVIMLNGITFAGFNTVDIEEIHNKTNLPIIVVSRKKPNLERFVASMKNLSNFEERVKCVENAGPFFSVNIKNKKVYFQTHGITEKDAALILKRSATRSLIPEPLRIAHLIATGIVLGESVGRA
jgi:endonuclease V-like protein UPF0215 family